jgi:geranylgeranyl pyrophosphate synthase
MTDSGPALIYNTRPTQTEVPATLKAREDLRQIVTGYVQSNKLYAPLGINELKHHATCVLKEHCLSAQYADFVAVLINNALWRETVAAIPYNKRLLLMPQCLRSFKNCRAQIDDIGLLCEHCGSCIIHDFKRQAEELGYAVLIAEGSPIVMSLIESGKIEAVIGVSCLSTLEKVFPYMEAGAVPGVAIPLLYDGCKDTAIDTDWLWEAVYEISDNPSIPRLDLKKEYERVDAWFMSGALELVIKPEGTQTETLAIEWMALEGKRWRPFLTACTVSALDPHNRIPEPEIQKIAVAVESFHKASLIHDDIEDGDRIRYGKETLHAKHGIPVALNTGDLLIGWGYQLLSELDAPGDLRAALINCAAHAHRIMCLGQGEELIWSQNPVCLSSDRVLDIFRKKTSPAFDVALTLGAMLAGADDSILNSLHKYSEAMGVAYQIRDDLEDYLMSGEEQHRLLDRPSIVIALATEQACGQARRLLQRAWQEPDVREREFERIIGIFRDLEIDNSVRELMKQKKSGAIDAMMQLTNPALKSLLRRVIGKIFGDFDLMGCCNDIKTGDDSGPGKGSKTAE